MITYEQYKYIRKLILRHTEMEHRHSEAIINDGFSKKHTARVELEKAHESLIEYLKSLTVFPDAEENQQPPQ